MNRAHDRGANRVTLTARLKNTSKDTLRGPVKVRVLTVGSEIAVARVANADNGVTGPGAVWDFSSTIPAAGLLPDSSAAAKDLVFTLSDVRPFRQGDANRFGIVNLTAKVLSPMPAKVAGRSDK